MAESFLDVKGLKCPLPVLKIQKALKRLNASDILEVHTTDPLSVIDVPNFCNESGNSLLTQSGSDDVHIFRIEKTPT